MERKKGFALTWLSLSSLKRAPSKNMGLDAGWTQVRDIICKKDFRICNLLIYWQSSHIAKYGDPLSGAEIQTKSTYFCFSRSSTGAAVGPFDLLSMTWELIKWQKGGGLSIPTRRRYSCSSSRHCWNAKPCLPFSQVPWTHYCGARSLLSMLGGISMWNFIQFLALRLNLDVGKDCPWIEDL